MVQNRRLEKEGTFTVDDHKIELVRSFKYLERVINDINDETEEIRARILTANKVPCKPYSELNKSIETIK